MSPLVSNIGRVRFRLVSLFEGLYPLACYWCHYSGSVELREVVCRVVVCAGHHTWTKPSLCEFMVGPVLIVKTNTQSPSVIFLGRSHIGASCRPGFMHGPRFLRSCRHPFHVFRPLFKFSNAISQQLLPINFMGDSLFEELFVGILFSLFRRLTGNPKLCPLPFL